jgi:hypothetical protein
MYASEATVRLQNKKALAGCPNLKMDAIGTMSGFILFCSLLGISVITSCHQCAIQPRAIDSCSQSEGPTITSRVEHCMDFRAMWST